MTKEALTLALEALYFLPALSPAQNELQDGAIEAIKEALAQPEQEPVALRHSFDGYGYLYTDMGFGSGWIEWTKRSHKDAEPLYTTPPQRTWVDLTDEQMWNAYTGGSDIINLDYAKSIVALFKEKNT